MSDQAQTQATTQEPADVVMAVLRCVEERDVGRLAELYHPDVEFHWPPGLPYSGVHRGAAVAGMSAAFAAVWVPLQPEAADRRLDAHVVAADGDTVVAQYTWKGRDRRGRTFATDTLARYSVVDGKLARARMYHFDLAGLVEFVERSRAEVSR